MIFHDFPWFLYVSQRVPIKNGDFQGHFRNFPSKSPAELQGFPVSSCTAAAKRVLTTGPKYLARDAKNSARRKAVFVEKNHRKTIGKWWFKGDESMIFMVI